MKKGIRIWLILLAAALALSALIWFARPRPDIWRTEIIQVEDAAGRVQDTISSPRAIRWVLKQLSKPTEEPWEDISNMQPTVLLEFMTPENGYGPVYYYQEYDICVTTDGVWVSVSRDFFDYLCQSMDAS